MVPDVQREVVAGIWMAVGTAPYFAGSGACGPLDAARVIRGGSGVPSCVERGFVGAGTFLAAP